jgi:predicted cupin superfamily sugar epimerase
VSGTTAAELIERLGLAPLTGEGGHYRETWRSDAGSAILYLLTPESFSALHRLPTDEIYHFYLGDPVEVLLLHPSGRSEAVTLGPDLFGGQRVQHTVQRGVWQGSRVATGGAWALLGTTMAPAFELAGYETGDRDALVAGWPGAAETIRALTRVEVVRPESAQVSARRGSPS